MSWNEVKRTSTALLALPLAASMLLAGCSGDDKPGASSSSTASASPTPSTASPTSSPAIDPNIPAAARAHTPAGAEAFVRYFYTQLNTAWTLPRRGVVSPLCMPTSKACASYEEVAARLTKEGHRYDGNPITIKFIGTLYASGPNKLDVLAKVVQERRSEIDQAGKTYVTDNRKDLRIDFELLYAGHAWSVVSSKIMK